MRFMSRLPAGPRYNVGSAARGTAVSITLVSGRPVLSSPFNIIKGDFLGENRMDSPTALCSDEIVKKRCCEGTISVATRGLIRLLLYVLRRIYVIGL